MYLLFISGEFVLCERREMVRRLDLKARLPVRLWKSYLTPLCFSLHICRMGIITVLRVVVGLNEVVYIHKLSTGSAILKTLILMLYRIYCHIENECLQLSLFTVLDI